MTLFQAFATAFCFAIATIGVWAASIAVAAMVGAIPLPP